MAPEKQVLFHIGEEVYGIDIVYVQGIEKYVNIIPVPNAPSYIEGIINLRGEIIPVFSLRDKFRLPKIPPTEVTKLLITKAQDVIVGFEVDAVSEIVELAEDDILEAPPMIKTAATGYVGAVANVKDKLVILLDLDGILSDAEKESLQGILEEHE